MNNKEKIRRYIKKQTEAGYSKEDIEKALLEVGWSSQSIDNAFNYLNKKSNPSKEQKNNKKLLVGSVFVLLILSFSVFGAFYILNEGEETNQRDNEPEMAKRDVEDEQKENIKEEEETDQKENKESKSNEDEEEVNDNNNQEVTSELDKKEESNPKDDENSQSKESEQPEENQELALNDADNCQSGNFQVDLELKEGDMNIPLKGKLSFLGLKDGYCQISYSLDIPEEDRNEIQALFKEQAGIKDLDYIFYPHYTGDQNFCFMPEEYFGTFHEELQSGAVKNDYFFDCITQSFQSEDQFTDFGKVITDHKKGDHNREFQWDITANLLLKFSFTEKISLEGSSNDGQCFFKSEVYNTKVLEEDVPPEEVEGIDPIQRQPGYCTTPCQGMIGTLLSTRSSQQLNFSTLSNPEGLNYSEIVEREDGTSEQISYVTTMTNGLPCVYASEELINKDPNIDSEDDIFKELLKHPEINND